MKLTVNGNMAEQGAESLAGQPEVEFTILMHCLNEAHGLAFCIEEAKDCIQRLGLDA